MTLEKVKVLCVMHKLAALRFNVPGLDNLHQGLAAGAAGAFDTMNNKLGRPLPPVSYPPAGNTNATPAANPPPAAQPKQPAPPKAQPAKPTTLKSAPTTPAITQPTAQPIPTVGNSAQPAIKSPQPTPKTPIAKTPDYSQWEQQELDESGDEENTQQPAVQSAPAASAKTRTPVQTAGSQNPPETDYPEGDTGGNDDTDYSYSSQQPQSKPVTPPVPRYKDAALADAQARGTAIKSRTLASNNKQGLGYTAHTDNKGMRHVTVADPKNNPQAVGYDAAVEREYQSLKPTTPQAYDTNARETAERRVQSAYTQARSQNMTPEQQRREIEYYRGQHNIGRHDINMQEVNENSAAARIAADKDTPAYLREAAKRRLTDRQDNAAQLELFKQQQARRNAQAEAQRKAREDAKKRSWRPPLFG